MTDTGAWFEGRLHDVIGHYVITGSNVIMDRELSDGAVRLYLWLRLLAGPRLWVTTQRQGLADLLQCKPREVTRRKTELEQAGLLRTRQVSQQGLCWTLLPPSTGQMAAVYDDILQREPVISRVVHQDYPAAARTPHPLWLDVLGGGGAGATQLRRTSEDAEKTENEVTCKRPTQPFIKEDPEFLAQAVSTHLVGLLVERLGPVEKDAARPVNRHDLLPWIDVGVDWRLLVAAWVAWLDHLRAGWARDPGTSPNRKAWFRAACFDQGASRRPWYDFIDWLLSGGELADADSRPTLPTQELLDLKRAASTVKAARTREANWEELDEPDEPTYFRVHAVYLLRLSLPAVGLLLAWEKMVSDGHRVLGDPVSPVLYLARDVAAHRKELEVPELALLVVNAVDELLDWGAVYQFPGQPPIDKDHPEAPLECGRVSHYHRRKHALYSVQTFCSDCECKMILHHGGAWMHCAENAVVHRDRLACAECVAEAVDEAGQDIPVDLSDGLAMD